MISNEELDILKLKVKVIENSINESCRYLTNVYNIYVKIISENNIKYDIDNNIMVNNGLKLINENNEYIVINKDYDFNLSNVVINGKINIAIKMDDFDIKSDWFIKIFNNFENILKRYNEFDIKEIEKYYEKIAFECILCPRLSKNLKNNKLKFDKVINYLDKVVKKCYKNNIKKDNIKFILIVNNDINCIDNVIIKEVITAIKTILIKDEYKRLTYVYDNLCLRIEEDLSFFKYCNFINNKCIAQRDIENKTEYPINEYNGCCYDVSKKKQCSKLINKNCETKCISCRLFICRYLRDRGIVYDVRDSLQIRVFINFIQRPELIWNFFQDKDVIIKCLAKRRFIWIKK